MVINQKTEYLKTNNMVQGACESMRNSLVFILILFLFFSFAFNESDACFSIIAGKSATEDGSVLLGHNEDNGMDDVSGMNEMDRTINSREEFALLSAAGIISQKTTRKSSYTTPQISADPQVSSIIQYKGNAHPFLKR